MRETRRGISRVRRTQTMIMHICTPGASRKRLKMFRKERNLFTEQNTSIRMKSSKGKNMLIKHNVTGNINTPFLWIETLISFVKTTVA
jgi:hypothetical protein